MGGISSDYDHEADATLANLGASIDRGLANIPASEFCSMLEFQLISVINVPTRIGLKILRTGKPCGTRALVTVNLELDSN